MSRNQPDVIIVGAGVVGLFSALELSDAGLRVRVIERGEVGQEASWAGGGILSPLHPWLYPEPVLELSRWAQTAYSIISKRLKLETGIDPEWARTGLLILEPESIKAASAWREQSADQIEILSSENISQQYPGLFSTGPGIILPEVAQIRSPRLLKSLACLLKAKRVQIDTHTPVEKILVENNKVRGVMTRQGAIAADCVVVATGAWGDEISPQPLRVPPVKGQMLLYAPSALSLTVIALQRDVYLIPRRDGRILVGSSVEDCGYDKTPTSDVRKRLRAQAERLLPGLSQVPLEHHWAGLRPGRSDLVPYVCEYPGIEGLFANIGHSRHGLLTAPASARLLADIMTGRSPMLDPVPYQIN